MSSKPNRTLVFFGHNRQDAAIVRRLGELASAGWRARAFTFRRDDDDGSHATSWENFDLGHIQHARFLRRILQAGAAFRAIWRNRHAVSEADLIYARNLDMALMAVVAGALFARRTVPMIYECLDVHEALTRPGAVAAMLRAAERWVLRRSQLLVHSSPGFIDHYFTPVQRYDGPSHWIENKLFLNAPLPRPCAQARRPDRPLTLVWAGIIRCEQTLAMLLEVARRRPDTVQIRIHGKVSYFLLPDFDERVAQLDNVTFHGAYTWPDGLTDVYADADVSWSQELSWRGYNSDWLIPNRIYEASYFGVPSLGLEDTETGRHIERRQLGFVLPDASADTVGAWLDQVSLQALSTARESLLQQDDGQFVHRASRAQLLNDALQSATDRLARA